MEIAYQMGGTFTLTYGVVCVEGFTSYGDAEAYYNARLTQVAPEKVVKVTRTGRTTEYDCHLDGEYVGSKRTRIEADRYLDKLCYERLSGLTFVRGE